MFGAATRAAIRAWQSSHGLSTTGYLDAGLAEALRTGSSPRPEVVSAPGGAGDPTVAGGLPDPVLAQQETVFWESAANSTNAEDLEAYLARWPNGVYAVLARNRLAALLDPPVTSDPDAVRTHADGDVFRDDLHAAALAWLEDVRTHADGDVFRDCDTCPEMVVIPAGEFLMGSPASEDGRFDNEGPQHWVAVSSFALGVTEVTFDEWEACVRGGGCNGYRPYDEGWGRGSRPVIHVNWNDAQAYVRWLSRETGESYRLPSEAEWEYAARGGAPTSRYWGDSSSSQCGHANGADAAAKRVYSAVTAAACNDGAVYTAPAGSYSSNAFGLFDVLGNVLEWTADCWHENYRGAPADGSPWHGGDCSRRVVRGGSWLSYPQFLRSAARDWYVTEYQIVVGFRVARTLD